MSCGMIISVVLAVVKLATAVDYSWWWVVVPIGLDTIITAIGAFARWKFDRAMTDVVADIVDDIFD